MIHNAPETNQLDPVDFMTYEQVFVEFLGEEKVENELERFIREREELPTTRGNNPVQNPAQPDPNPILNLIKNARKEFDRYWATGKLAKIEDVIEIAVIGEAIQQLGDSELVDSNGDNLHLTIADIYPQKFWDEEDFWDHFFEMEVGALFESVGLDAKLIHEGQEGGPDILIDKFENPIWIECKRKRNLTPKDEEWTRLKTRLLYEVWERLDIGDDGFVLRIQSETELDESQLDGLAAEISILISDQKDSLTTVLGGQEIKLKLLDYCSGANEISLKPQDNGGLHMFEDSDEFDTRTLSKQTKPSPIGKMLAMDPFSHLNYSVNTEAQGQAYAIPELSEDGNALIKNACIVEFDVLNKADYRRGIKSAIDTACDDLIGYSPGIAVIHVPFERWEKLNENKIPYQGEEISQRKRLEINVKGILLDNPHINAIVLTSRTLDRGGNQTVSGRFGYSYVNKYPSVTIQDEFESFLKEEFTTDWDVVDASEVDRK